MSVHRGSGNHQKSNRYFTISFFLITAVTTLLWLIYATCMPKLLHLMGANDTLFPYAMSYMRYINIFLPRTSGEKYSNRDLTDICSYLNKITKKRWYFKIKFTKSICLF